MLYFKKKDYIWNNNLEPLDIYNSYYWSIHTQGIKDNNNNKVHPTMKPLKLLSDKMQISSNKNSVVLDLFGGSGSTMFVAEQLERECLMIEKSIRYVNVIIDRMKKLGLEHEIVGHLDFADEYKESSDEINDEV